MKENGMKKSNNHILEIKKVEEDPRGHVYSGNFNGKNFIILSFKKGAPRGGHYHNLKTIHFVLYGSLKLKTKELNKNREEIKVVKSGDVVITKPKLIHIFIALENSLILELREKGLETIEYPPYRKIVNEFIKIRS
jgi:quercetin dioxygenase-like cupin family protein